MHTTTPAHDPDSVTAWMAKGNCAQGTTRHVLSE